MAANTAKEKGKFSLKRLFARIARFFKDMKGEMKKVVWPSKKQIVNNTLVVIAFVVLAAVVIGLFDLGISALINLFFAGA